MSLKDPPSFEGILLVDKPSGITSHDIVDRLRRKLKMKKIGHAGTLDPLATGLMIMLIGKATKVSQFLISLDKSYEGEFRLGIETNSQDSDGEVVSEKSIPEDLTKEKLAETMKTFWVTNTRLPQCFLPKRSMAFLFTRWLEREK